MDKKEAAEKILIGAGRVFREIVGHFDGRVNGMFAALGLIRESDGLSPSEISLRSGVSMPRVAAVLNRLEERGLIERVAAEGDGRRKIIRITKKGEEFDDERRKKVEEYIGFYCLALRMKKRTSLCGFLPKYFPKAIISEKSHTYKRYAAEYRRNKREAKK